MSSIKPDFSVMTGPQLVTAYNSMVVQAQGAGIATARPVTRFSGLDAGCARCEKMWALVNDLEADAAAPPNEDRPAVAPQMGNLKPIFLLAKKVEQLCVRLQCEDETPYEDGWYYQTGVEDAPIGPFKTEAEAIQDKAAYERDLRSSHLVNNEQTFKTDGEEPEAATPATSVAEADEDDDMAKKRKAAAKAARTPRKRAANGSGETLASYTKVWNDLVPAAVKAGIKGVKHHSSDFESAVKAKARIAWLEKELRK